MSEKRMQIMRDASYLLPPPGGEVVRELLDRHAALLARHNALKEAARLLIITTQPVLGEDGHLWITEHAVGKLAALVGEE